MCSGPLVKILPYIEQQAIYAKWKFGCAVQQGTSITRYIAQSTMIDTFICPSDRYQPGWAQTNYTVSIGPNLGWSDDLNQMNGMFRRREGVRMRDVTDGTSNTVLLAERLIGDANNGINSLSDLVYGIAAPAGITDPHCMMFPPQPAVEQWGYAAAQVWTPQFSGCCSSEDWSCGDHYINECASPNWHYPDTKWQGCGWRQVEGGIYPSRSKHPGGVIAAYADASIHFVSSSIDYNTWQYLGARNDGQPVTPP